jgi:hypothetical protein
MVIPPTNIGSTWYRVPLFSHNNSAQQVLSVTQALIAIAAVIGRVIAVSQIPSFREGQ